MVAKEGNIFLDRISKKSEQWSNGIFLIVPLRLGLNRIEPEYLQSIREVFTTMKDQSVGIAGGKDFSALYFVGMSDSDKLLYLDPHFVQKAIPTHIIHDQELLLEFAKT